MVLNGKCAACGIAMGRIYIYKDDLKIPEECFIPEYEEQPSVERYLAVKRDAISEMEKIRLSLHNIDPEIAKIFSAHCDIIEDIIFNEEIPARIKNEHWSGDWAIYQVYETVISAIRKSADPVFRERTADFIDIRTLLLSLWHGEKKKGLTAFNDPVIVAARELLPSDAARMDRSKVLAILLENGSENSHAAIISKCYKIPFIFGIDNLLETVKQGQLAAVNADEGYIILDV